MIEYKYQKVKGLSEKKFLENGHTMFETDVLQRLKRLAHLEEQITLPIDSVSNSVCECCNENEAKVTVKLCHSCEEHKLNTNDR